MEKIILFEILILVFFTSGVSLSFSRLNQGNVFRKRVNTQKQSSENPEMKFVSGGMEKDGQPLTAGNNSNPQVETISSIVNETLRECANMTLENTTVLPGTGINIKPKIPPENITSIVNSTLFKVMGNVSRDDPSAGSAMDKDEGSGSGSGYISCEMCPSCVGCVVMPMSPASSPDEGAHVGQSVHGKEIRRYALRFQIVCLIGVDFNSYSADKQMLLKPGMGYGYCI